MALFAENPGDGVNDVGFAAAVRANDAGSTRPAERDHGAFAERLKANDFDFSQLQQDVPFGRQLLHCRHQQTRKQIDSCESQLFATARARTREERRRFVPRGEGLWFNRSTVHRSPVKTFGRFSVRGPAAWRKDGGTGKNSNTMHSACKALRYNSPPLQLVDKLLAPQGGLSNMGYLSNGPTW